MDTPSSQKSPAAGPGGRLVRWVVRAAVLALAVALVSPLGWGSQAALWVPGASALVAAAAVVARHPAGWITVVGLVIAGVALFQGRWFCRWVCPMGSCVDVASLAGAGLGRRGVRLAPVGQWLALGTLAGAVLGWPVFAWSDPLAIFSAGVGAIGLTDMPAWYVSAVLFLTILGGSLVLPGVWCGRLCPLGGLQELLAALGRWRPGRAPSAAPKRARWPVARRAVLGVLVGLIGAAALRRAAAQATPSLRPPGAVPEDLFGGLCVRCGNCVRACPTEILFPAVADVPLPWLLTPVVRFGEKYCLETCVRCTEVCPSGALARLIPQRKAAHPMGLAEVDLTLCLRAQDQECALCRARCPYDAIRYVFSEEEYISVPRVDPRRCPGCGACEVACPTTPAKAIVVRPLVPGRRQSISQRKG